MKNKKLIIILTLIFILTTVACLIGYQYYQFCHIYPKITLIGDDKITLALDEEYNELGATSMFKKQEIETNITGEVDTSKVGEYEIVYKTNNTRNKNQSTIKRYINVIDNTNPEITLKGDEKYSIYVNQSYKELGFTATDNYDGDITDKVKITGEVNNKEKGTYELIYSVNDSSNNYTEVKRTITVKEKPAPKPKETTTTNTKGLPVLMYHFFYDDTKGETGNDNNWMSKTAFEEQMKYLSDNKYYFPSWQEVEDYVNGKILLPSKSVVITIDDGDITFINHAIPIIEKYNVKATSFAVTVWTGEDLANKYKDNNTNLVIESHSYDAHKAGKNGKGLLVNMTYEEALNDAIKSRDLTNNSTVFCYPFGHYNDTVINALKDANYHMAFTTKGGRVYPGQNLYTLPRVRMSRGITLEDFVSKVE